MVSAHLPDAIPFTELRRALVVKLRHHGDVLLAGPVFSALRRAAPACEIDALVYADTAPMLAEHPAIDRIHTIDRAWKHAGARRQLHAEWRLLTALRQRRYDLVIHLTGHPRGAWIARLCGARWAVAPRRPGKFWRRSFSHTYPGANPRRHTVETHLDALRRLGLQPDPADRRLVMVPGLAAESRIAELCRQFDLPERGFVHIHPTSRWLFKCWPAERVAALADALAAEGWPVALTAAPDPGERAMVAAIAAAARRPLVDLSGQLSLRELAALTGRARLFVGVDSAPMHIAAAMATPTVALFGPSGEREWGPWQVSQRLIVSDHSCRPCGQDGCGGGKISECLSMLPVERVLAACRELLAQ